MHHCVINCKIPMDMPYHYARHAIRVILFPVLEEFGYVIPEEDLQQRLEKRYGECTKAMMISLFLSDEEAIKTASIRAEWKPLETTVALDKSERKALRKMSKKRSRDNTECHICLDTCKRPITIECDHTFCYECIKKWMGIKRTCPVCDKEINVAKYMREKRQKRPCKKILPK